jgi:hypothetical protein
VTEQNLSGAATAASGKATGATESFDLRHALAVASHFDYGSAAWTVALFHDAIEDGAVDDLDLVAAGLPPLIVQAVVEITRHANETYGQYIERLDKRGLTADVKRVDLAVNLARLDRPHESLRPRYEKALRVLEGEA